MRFFAQFNAVFLCREKVVH